MHASQVRGTCYSSCPNLNSNYVLVYPKNIQPSKRCKEHYNIVAMGRNKQFIVLKCRVNRKL